MIQCKVCNSDLIEDTDFGRWQIGSEVFNYSKCYACGFIFCNPQPSQKLLHKLYSDYYPYEWFAKRKLLKKTQAYHRVFKLHIFKDKKLKILDYGAGHGYFLEALKSRGFNAFGYDPEIGVAEANAYFSKIDDIPNSHFDIITLWHTFEHIINTEEVLQYLQQKLTPTGKIVIVLPNSAALGLNLMKRKWVWLQEPYFHVNHFNRHNLAKLVQNYGFKISRVSTKDTWDAQIYDWGVQRFINLIKWMTRQRGREWFWVEETLRLFCTIPSYLLNPVLNILNKGSELILIAEKKNTKQSHLPQ